MKIKPYIEDTVSMLDSEEMVDAAYNGLVSLLDLVPQKGLRVEANVIGGPRDKKHMSHFEALLSGVYIPGSRRCYWVGRFDLSVDALPDRGSVYCAPESDARFEWATVRRVAKLPRGIYTTDNRKSIIYEVTITKTLKNGHSTARDVRKDSILDVDVSYFTISENGDVETTIDTSKLRWFATTSDAYNGARYGAGALSILADRKYLWMVESTEKSGIHPNVNATVQFGVEEPYIKSLLYARSLPMTAAGRKRPILHWVQAHKRMIELGSEIDVGKHLRGVDSLEMGGLNFSITSPRKAEVSAKLRHERELRRAERRAP